MFLFMFAECASNESTGPQRKAEFNFEFRFSILAVNWSIRQRTNGMRFAHSKIISDDTEQQQQHCNDQSTIEQLGNDQSAAEHVDTTIERIESTATESATFSEFQ